MQTLLNSPLCYATRRKFPPPRPWNIIAGSVVRARVVLLCENPTTVGEAAANNRKGKALLSTNSVDRPTAAADAMRQLGGPVRN
jgi:hypothetical protein